MHSDRIGILGRIFRSSSIEKPRKWSYERTSPCRGPSVLVIKLDSSSANVILLRSGITKID
jgi:hypothetical protein